MSKSKDAVPAPAAGTAKPKKKGEVEQEEAELEGLMSDIEADLRTDEFKKIWARHGTSLTALVVALLIGVTGFQLYRQYNVSQHEAAGRRYEVAVSTKNAGKTDEALKEFAALSQENPKGYGALARLNQAAIQIEKKDIAGAVVNYTALAADQKADPVLRDIATLLYVLHSLDREDPKTLEAALTPLTNPDNAFNTSAMELQALLAAKQGDNARAVKTLAQISSEASISQSMRDRVEDLSKLYGAGVIPPAAPVAPAPAAPPAVAPAAASPAAKP